MSEHGTRYPDDLGVPREPRELSARCAELAGRLVKQGAALRELEAENRLYSESLANATQEIERLESRLAAALHLIPGNVLIGELRELAERYRAALEGK